MIRILLNVDKYQYDIHSLFKAFYGNEDVKVVIIDKCGNDDISRNEDDGEEFFAKVDILTREKSDECIQGIVVVSIQEVNKEMKFVDFLDVTKNDNASTSGEDHTVDTSKNAVKKAIYLALREVTGRDLPWGNLTGIRPTRIAMNLIDNGKSDEEIFNYMKNTYFVSDEKIKLSISIARREKEILKDIDYENGYSLYIGIPFCPTTLH